MGNNLDNFQLHRFTRSENIAKSFRGGATFFDSHCSMCLHQYLSTLQRTCHSRQSICVFLLYGCEAYDLGVSSDTVNVQDSQGMCCVFCITNGHSCAFSSSWCCISLLNCNKVCLCSLQQCT